VITGTLVAVGLVLLPVLGVWVWTQVWRGGGRFSLYDRAGGFAVPFGENARYGFEAGLPAGLTISGIGLAIGGVLATPEIADASWRWPELVTSTLIPVVIVCFFSGWALGLSLLLFLLPRFLAPPHLRDKRGWIPEWLFQMTQHRAERRARRRRP
jgi:hypothetical protein